MQSLNNLKDRANFLTQHWVNKANFELIDFYVKVLPKVFDCERCSIFLRDEDEGLLYSHAGTGLSQQKISAPTSGSIVGRVLTTGRVYLENHVDKLNGFHQQAQQLTGFEMTSTLCAPIASLYDGTAIGVVQLLNKNDDYGFNKDDTALVCEFTSVLSIAVENMLLSQQSIAYSESVTNELKALKQKESGFIAASPAMQKIQTQIQSIAPLPISILITGENGTGKEEVAKQIVKFSTRDTKPVIAINCASIPENLFESEFFGHEKGAFTGAHQAKPGYFEQAKGGTLFLDEVGELPPQMQSKLLRVLQENKGKRVGGAKEVDYDFRLLCATNRNLESEIEGGNFREDLFYRLFSVEINLPPLRDRKEDIIALALTFYEQIKNKFNKNLKGFTPEFIDKMTMYRWPGNVRQLRREIEKLVALSPEGEYLDDRFSVMENIDNKSQKYNNSDLPSALLKMEIEMIKKALKESNENRAQAAKKLGITRQSLNIKLKKFNLHNRVEKSA